MTRQEILDLVNAIYFGPKGNSIITALLDRIECALPHANVSDLIFWSFPALTPEEVVEEGLRQEAEYIARHGSRSQ